MRKRVPLNAIRAFEAVARNKSVVNAGRELGVTSTAVSHQLRSLEEFLQVDLFERRGNRLLMTERATANVDQISRALDMIDSAVRNIGGTHLDDVSRLVIGSSPSFASFWLMPRLREFLDASPGVDLVFNTFLTRQEAETQVSDIRICNWESDTNDLVEPLLKEASVPVCSPELAARYDNDTQRLLREAPLIHVDRRQLGLDGDYPDWPKYLGEFGIDRADVMQGSSFNQAAIAIDAAKEAVGVLLGRSLLTAAYLKNGDLLEIAEAYPEPNTYYIRRERGAEQREVMDNFCAWLRQAAKSCGISAVN